ncbi:MAG: exopolysaccharide transport family protein [Acidobacteriaceae bacterium]
MIPRAAYSGPPPEWTLADLLAALARRRVWIVSSLAVCCTLSALFWLTSTPRYRATSVIEVQKDSHGAFGLESITDDKPSAALSDSFDDALALQTEIGILQSDALALDVIQRAGLETTSDYFAPHPGHFPWLRRLFFWRKPLEPLSVPLENAPDRRYVALKIFAKHCKIAPTAGTRLISVSYTDPDPHRAAAIANALVQALADYSFQSRSTAATQSAAWLQTQLAQLRQQTDALDTRAAALDRAAGDFGDDSSHNVVLSRLDDLNAALTQAQSSRIVREAIWRAVQSGNPEVISGLGGNPAIGPNTQNSFELLQSLRAQQASAQAQLAESQKRYGVNWPAVAEQRARLATIEQSIQQEIGRLGQRARSDYEVSLQAETAARSAFEQQKDQASQLTGDAVALRLARQEADGSRTLYATLLGRLQQTGVLAGLHSGNFAVVTPALIPPDDHPASPSPPLLAALALAAGLTLGCSAALLRELTDRSVHSAADLESLLDAPVLAALPEPQPAQPWYRQWPRRFLPAPRSVDLTLEAAAASDFAIPAPQPPYVEALHRLRAGLLLSHSERPPQVIAIVPVAPVLPGTRAEPAPYSEESSPSLALSLAAVLAQHGASVLCVDADLRSAPAAAFPSDPGLTDLLTADRAPAYAHPASAPPLLSVIHTGTRPPCPSELIASPRMAALLARWRQEFNFIVIDSPAAIYADALVLAQLSDAVLLAAQAGRSRRDQILPAFDALSRQVPGHAVLALVLDGVSTGASHALA